MNKTTIQVDLSYFYKDERRMALIFVDPKWKTVECLQKRLELLFDISSIWLSSAGCFLPSNEPIEIIRCCDVIKAFHSKESLKIKKNKSKQFKETLEESKSKDKKSEKVNRQKDDNDELVSSTHVTNSIESHNILDECNKEGTQFSFKNSSKSSKKRKCANDEEITTACSSKFASSTLLNESNMLEECNKTKDLPKYENPFKKRKSSNKAHIYFSESGDALSSKSKKEKKLTKEAKESEPIVVFRCALNSQPSTQRIFKLKQKNPNAKQKLEIKEHVLIIPAHSIENATIESSISNEATMINKENTREASKANLALNNSTIAESDKKEEASLEKLNNLQSKETGINEAADVSLTLNKNKSELTVSVTQTESPNEHIIGSDALGIQNKTNEVDPQMDKTNIDKTFGDETSIMSIDCVDLSIDLDDETTDVEEVSEIIDLNESEYNCSTALIQDK